jgi:quinol monooxygenase YgiN
LIAARQKAGREGGTMNHEILAIAVIRPFEGQEEELLHVLRDLHRLLKSKNYSLDVLYRDAKDPGRFFNFRYWLSDETRRAAFEDADVQRFWQKLGTLCEAEKVYEQLIEVET